MSIVHASRSSSIQVSSWTILLATFGVLCCCLWSATISITKRTVAIELASSLDPFPVAPVQSESRTVLISSNASLAKRDQYACKKGSPCKSNACCGSFFGGDMGECGFGPTFCGTDCDSQCDAKPECGQYANLPGKECPLNVCCSEFGFCGTTSDFCTGKCQSNCVLEPPVPAGKSEQPVLSRVVGYYESWSARRNCRSFPPAAIPVQGLTHVNFAFAYIDATSLRIITMDGETPEDLFSQTTNIRSLASGASPLQVFIAIGGWTFSDDGAATQPVFSSIAADPAKRQLFANNLLSFMIQHGFDGVDLDWEYPGASDRGGQGSRDTQNYVELLKTVYSTFQASTQGNFGISFTIPSSYWYLRWFDVPNMLKYADWVNLMSYDLHGVWDQSNPIGSIVQGHTNLTEIKLSLDLLWRNQVPPGKVVLGLGFYGRSFQLRDTTCATPGCQFSGPAEAGACTTSAGTLAYFEIMDIINQQNPTIIRDDTAAVNYFTYGAKKDQWISYDDAGTFKAKINFANSIGLGGVMIWSIDQDDEQFSALEGLLGQSMSLLSKKRKQADIVDAQHWAGLNGQKCYASDCLPEHANPPPGFSVAPNGGFYPDRCGSGKGKYIYCPTDAMPQKCEWRGSGSCHGQCRPGEVTLAHSPHGSTYCLVPGQQAFCCVSGEWAPLIESCKWTNHCEACSSDAQYAVSTRKVSNGIFKTCDQKYCCPFDFQNCHWVGKGTCDDNECSGTDVQVALDGRGDTGSYCGGGLNNRQKALCCNTPSNLNPFLPVPVEDLFPTLPPSGSIAAFDKQSLTHKVGLVGGNELPNAFFFVVIDGPPDAVSNLNKRDGSHLEFLSRGEHHGQEPQITYFICMDGSESSNCNDMHLDGLNGTIIRLPDDLGFAQYGVAHSVTGTDIPVPRHLAKRAPAGARVYVLSYSYNFSKVKRASGPVYVRIDYSDSVNYYDDVVAAAHAKRSETSNLEARHRNTARFWSKDTSLWASIIKRLRSQEYNTDGSQPSLKLDGFDTLLYGSDGSTKNCSGPIADGYLRVHLSGSLRNTLKFGTTLVGTISPSLQLEEAYSYVNHDMYMSGQLDFDGRGNIDIGATTESRPILSSPVTGFQASHPGIVSFSPSMNIEATFAGAGQMDGKFSVKFESGSYGPITLDAPTQDAFRGTLGSDETTFNTLFALDLNFESTMGMQIFNYDTSTVHASSAMTARTPHYVRVVGNDGTGKPAVFDSARQATAEVAEIGSIANDWSDGTTHAIGVIPKPVTIYVGNEPPAVRPAPSVAGYSIFGDRDFVQCTPNDDERNRELTCTWDIKANDPTLVQPDPPYKEKRLFQAYPQSPANGSPIDRRGGPSSGNTNTYVVLDANPPPAGPTPALQYITPTYPNGDNGDALDEETGRTGERFAIQNPGQCDDITVDNAAVIPGPSGQTVESDHIFDRSIYPNRFLRFVQTGRFDMEDGQGERQQTNAPLFTFAQLDEYFNRPYNQWQPPIPGDNTPVGTASTDTADALGSTAHPQGLINLESSLNTLKGRLITREGDPTANDVWDTYLTGTQRAAEAALSALRAVFVIFGYMNRAVPHQQLGMVFEDIQVAHNQFDALYRLTTNNPARMAVLWRQFVPLWLTRVENFSRAYMTRRLSQLEAIWIPINIDRTNPLQPFAQGVLLRTAGMRNLINTELRFNRTDILPRR